MQTKFAPWYAKSSAGETQGLVIEEGTGRTVAVTYNAADAPPIAALPELVAALQMVCDSGVPLADEIERAMLDALAKVNGE